MRRPLLYARSRPAVCAAVLLALAAVDASADTPAPETVAAWDAYVRATEARITAELDSAGAFDFGGSTRPDDPASGSQVAVHALETSDAAGRPLRVPGGQVHHWRGRVFIPGARLDAMLDRLQNPQPDDAVQDDVTASRLVGKGPEGLRVYLRLERTHLVTAVYDTEHLVRFTRHGPGHATSRSTATRIVELVDPGTPSEGPRPTGHDRGFLWRLNSYWRYAQTPGGVLVECESISLSRSIPSLLHAVVRPVVDRIARRSMTHTLESLKRRVTNWAAVRHGKERHR